MKLYRKGCKIWANVQFFPCFTVLLLDCPSAADNHFNFWTILSHKSDGSKLHPFSKCASSFIKYRISFDILTKIAHSGQIPNLRLISFLSSSTKMKIKLTLKSTLIWLFYFSDETWYNIIWCLFRGFPLLVHWMYWISHPHTHLCTSHHPSQHLQCTGI